MGTKTKSVVVPYELKPAAWSSTVLSIEYQRFQTEKVLNWEEKEEREEMFSVLQP